MILLVDELQLVNIHVAVNEDVIVCFYVGEMNVETVSQ